MSPEYQTVLSIFKQMNSPKLLIQVFVGKVSDAALGELERDGIIKRNKTHVWLTDEGMAAAGNPGLPRGSQS